jgi:hypothetical protein
MPTISRRSISSLSRSIGFVERSPLLGREKAHRLGDLNPIEQLFARPIARLRAFLRKMKAQGTLESNRLFSQRYFQEECKASNAGWS